MFHLLSHNADLLFACLHVLCLVLWLAPSLFLDNCLDCIILLSSRFPALFVFFGGCAWLIIVCSASDVLELACRHMIGCCLLALLILVQKLHTCRGLVMIAV